MSIRPRLHCSEGLNRSILAGVNPLRQDKLQCQLSLGMHVEKSTAVDFFVEDLCCVGSKRILDVIYKERTNRCHDKVEVCANGRASSTKNSGSIALGLMSIVSSSWAESRTMTQVDMRSSSSQTLFIRCLVPWTVSRSSQPIIKEISPKCSLEGLMLKLKLQYFGLLMRRADSFEKTPMLRKIEGRRRRG